MTKPITSNKDGGHRLRLNLKPAYKPATVLASSESSLPREKTAFLVDATGEDLRTDRASMAFELLRNGFAEWAGISRKAILKPVIEQSQLTQESAALLPPALAQTPGYSEMPIVLCTSRHLASAVISSEASTSLLILGSSMDPGERARMAERSVKAPFELPTNVDFSAVAWFGAPQSVVEAGEYVAPRLCCEARSLSVHTVQAYLRKFTALVQQSMNWRVCLLVYLDSMKVDRTDGSYVDDGVVAACLGWMQQQPLDCSVILLSERKVSPLVKQRLGSVTKHLGSALQLSKRSKRPAPPGGANSFR